MKDAINFIYNNRLIFSLFSEHKKFIKTTMYTYLMGKSGRMDIPLCKTPGIKKEIFEITFQDILLLIKNYKLEIKGEERKGIWEKETMLKFFQVNRDIFLRTLCLVVVTLFFTSAGASQGEIILAVNTLLMQLFTLFSYVMDGFAYAGEALSGRYIGAHNREAFTDTVRHLFGWGAVMAVLFTLTYALGGNAFLGLLTDDKEVIAVADTYFYWALAVPAVGIAAFIWDGIFIGATATRGMLLSMTAAAVSFFVLYYGLHPVLANHALWLAFLTYLLMRGAVQTGLSRGVIKKAFPSEK